MADSIDPVILDEQIRRNAVTDRLQVYLAEFSAARNEITQLSTKQQNLLITSFAVSSYAFSSLVTSTTVATETETSEGKSTSKLLATTQLDTTTKSRAESNPRIDQGIVFFLLFLILCGLGILFCDVDRAIIRCAQYVESHLKKKLRVLTGDSEILEWERYIRGKSRILSRFRHSPLNAAFQGSLIAIPATGCFLRFFLLMIKGQPLLSSRLGALVAGSLLLGFFLFRLAIVFTQRIRLQPHQERPRDVAAAPVFIAPPEP